MLRVTILFFVLLFSALVLSAQEAALQRLHIEEPMSVELQQRLTAGGIELLEYLGGRDYVVRVSSTSKKMRSTVGKFAPFSVKEKIAPAILATQTQQLTVRLFLVPHTPLPRVRSYIETLGGVYWAYDSLLCAVRCTIARERLEELANSDDVLWVHPLPRLKKINDKDGKLMSDVPLVQHENDATGLDLTGRGVRIGIWDETIDPHPDLRDKISVQETSLASTGHGTHVAGIILGAGFLNEEARGMSPQARAWNYNFKFQDAERDDWEEVQEAYQKHHFSLTNNSYGIAYEEDDCSDYEQMVYDYDAPFDLIANRYPQLTHVFAAGNGRNEKKCLHKYNNGYGSSPSRGKNLIYVGAIAADKKMTAFSAWGPMDDGRLIPTVVAHGGNVLSADQGQGYRRLSGTSMACPAVTGQLALVTEYYARLNNYEIPRSDLLRALLANTTEEIYPEGPDYATGYGLANTANMIEVLREQQYILGQCDSQGAIQDHEIFVPDGVKRVRVMLAWNDAVTLKPYTWGEKALVNDLDLCVQNGDTKILPWVLDPAHPSLMATRGEDHLNTMEQVTIASPKRLLKISVKATALPKPSQPYVLVWYFEKEAAPVFLLPQVGERLGEHFTVKMKGLQTPVRLRILNKQGNTLLFQTLHKLTYEVVLPLTQSDTIWLQATDQMGRMLTSRRFVRLPVPKLTSVENSTTIPNGVKVSWQKINMPHVSFHYSICIACSADDNWKEIGRATSESTSYEIPPEQLFGATQVAVAVRVVQGKAQGQLSQALFTRLLPPRTDATVSTLPSSYASIRMTDVANQTLEEGATVQVNAMVNLTIHTVAERKLKKLLVNGEEILFTPADDGYYTAVFKIPTKGLYRNFCFETQTEPDALPTNAITLHYDAITNFGLQVKEEGILRKPLQKLRRDTWLSFQCEEKGTKRPVYFMVNGVRLDGTYNGKTLEAKYHLSSAYDKSELHIDCAYTELPAVLFAANVYGTEKNVRVEYTSNGAPILPNDMCARGEILSIRVLPIAALSVEKILCNGSVLELDEHGDAYVAEYLVPTSEDVTRVHAEIYLEDAPTGLSETWAATVQVTPNPFADRLRIVNNDLYNGSYTLYTALGQCVRTGSLCNKEVIVNTADLRAGLYILCLVAPSGETKTFRLVKE